MINLPWRIWKHIMVGCRVQTLTRFSIFVYPQWFCLIMVLVWVYKVSGVVSGWKSFIILSLICVWSLHGRRICHWFNRVSLSFDSLLFKLVLFIVINLFIWVVFAAFIFFGTLFRLFLLSLIIRFLFVKTVRRLLLRLLKSLELVRNWLWIYRFLCFWSSCFRRFHIFVRMERGRAWVSICDRLFRIKLVRFVIVSPSEYFLRIIRFV